MNVPTFLRPPERVRDDPKNLLLRAELITAGANEHERARRWRRLVRFVASNWQAIDRDLFGETIDEIGREAAHVRESTRAETALLIASERLPVELVAVFAGQPLSVAAAVLSCARLRAVDWARVEQAATAECRRFLATIGDTREHFLPAKVERMHRGRRDFPVGKEYADDNVSASQKTNDWGNAGEAPSVAQADRSDAGAFNWPVNELVTRIKEFEARPTESSQGKQAERAAEGDDGEPLSLKLVHSLERKMTRGLEDIVALSAETATDESCVNWRSNAARISNEAHRMLHVLRELREL